ncbi:MAG: hypothetical protein R6X02_25015, partial [Enhygromyxa sp.]
RFADHAGSASRLLCEKVDTPALDFVFVLHGLVSGTLDVDRLDYLVRDSLHCGVPYGRCDTDLLIRSLGLGVVDGRIRTLLDRKAVHALDDMLWSRYQLFLQVYNHKTNVGLNAALASALSSAIAELRIHRPREFHEFIAFIDDHILGNLFFSAELGELDDRWYTQVLVDRRVPKHLHTARVMMGDDPAQIAANTQERLAQSLQIAPSDILIGSARSTLLKSGSLPHVMSSEPGSGEYELDEFEALSSVIGDGKLADSEYILLHFFTDRRKI